ncbi:RING-H2 finger protein ATL54-like [Vigna umbellata]|uniref:RING-H2 finger protein ATL54-like n=1 Tax=Vigna umbellata TaxID=87088 RepID=UPI001F5EE1ED|nr:RING-H2 finger protein ATL54-like [Vigna umbellata]
MDLFPWCLIIGTLAISFTFFTLVMLGWCLDINHILSLPTTGLSFDDKFSPCMSLESHSITFNYQAAEGTHQTECVICLTSFEEEESVRKLHSCKHIFHTLCIDKWLGSHSGCPLCRTQIDKVSSQNSRVSLEENDHMIMVIVNS